MEFFERAHGVNNKSLKNKKLTENKKKQLKQMLFGYRSNDNKLIQKSSESQYDYEDSTSVSGYSDLNLTNSSNEDQNPLFISNGNTSVPLDGNIEEDISKEIPSEGSESYKNIELSGNNSNALSNKFIYNDNKGKLSLTDESISECNGSIYSFESDNLMTDVSEELATGSDVDNGSDTSIIIGGLNLSESDTSEFDADRQLAAKIQEQLQIKNRKQMHKNKYSIVLEENDIVKGPITKKTCGKIQMQKDLTNSDKNLTTPKNNEQKHKDKFATTSKENKVRKGPITKERCIMIQAEQLNKDDLKQLKDSKKKHKDKYTIVLDPKQRHKQKCNTLIDGSNPVGPVTIEMLSDQEENVLVSVRDNICNQQTSSNEASIDEINDYKHNDVELNYEQHDSLDSVMSPAYVSIIASDMPIQRLDDIVGEYKHSTVRNLPSENTNVLSLNSSGFVVEDNMNADVEMEDDVSSLIPELDDIPKLEDVDEEIIDLNTTNDSLNQTMNATDTNELEITVEEPSVAYENVTDLYKVHYGTSCCVITLQHPSELFIQGKASIQSLAGTVELFGYTLNQDFYDVYAPYYNFAQCVKTVENDNDYFGLFRKLTALGLTVLEAEEIVTKLGKHDAVICLRKLNSVTMDFVENNFRITNIFKWNKTVEPYFNKACNLLDCSLFSLRPYKSFYEHPSWSEAQLLAINKYSRGIVCGGKGAGKSTYIRYQVNRLLTHGPVLVVDLDPGQSLFTVAGNLSATVVTSPVFGPSFTTLRKPELMLNIGLINTMDNVKLYASAVRTLIALCQSNKAFAQMPWLVNTMGMTISVGLKLITLIITLLKPSYVLQYESQLVNQRFETLLTPMNVKDLYEDYRSDRLFENVLWAEDLDYSFVVAHDTDSPHRNKTKFSLRPKDERYLNFLAYFAQLLEVNRGKSLLGITPYMVSLKDLRIATNVIVKKEHLTKVLNGKLVALCQHASDCGVLFTLTDKPLLCRGHGLIRGIDWEEEVLYVITPVPSDDLGGVDTLVYADWLPELLWHEKQLPLGTVLSYRTSTADKQLMSTPCRRFNNPLQLLKLARGMPK